MVLTAVRPKGREAAIRLKYEKNRYYSPDRE